MGVWWADIDTNSSNPEWLPGGDWPDYEWQGEHGDVQV